MQLFEICYLYVCILDDVCRSRSNAKQNKAKKDLSFKAAEWILGILSLQSYFIKFGIEVIHEMAILYISSKFITLENLLKVN